MPQKNQVTNAVKIWKQYQHECLDRDGDYRMEFGEWLATLKKDNGKPTKNN